MTSAAWSWTSSTPQRRGALGIAFAEVVAEPQGATRVAIGRDMRASSPALSGAFAGGVSAAGLEAVDIGLASTDGLYFASGHLGVPGAMFTASHNPARYNGIKLTRAGAQPVGRDTGLEDVRRRAAELLAGAAASPRGAGRAVGDGRAGGIRGVPPVAGGPGRHPAAARRRRRGERDGRIHGARGARGPGGPAAAAADDHPALFRPRRNLPQPRGQPARPGEPGRPASGGPRARCRPRPGVRRRRGPLLRRRRTR